MAVLESAVSEWNKVVQWLGEILPKKEEAKSALAKLVEDYAASPHAKSFGHKYKVMYSAVHFHFSTILNEEGGPDVIRKVCYLLETLARLADTEGAPKLYAG